MLGLLLPRVIDHRFRGQWLGYWLIAPVLFVKTVIALVSMLTPGQANKADAIDLSTYSAAALHDAMTFTALLGLLHFCIALFCLLAVIRYRALVPLIYLWLLVEFLARRVILELYPMDRVHGLASGSLVNLVLFTMLALGLALSIWPRRDAQAPATVVSE